jgi:hypothetical protein
MLAAKAAGATAVHATAAGAGSGISGGGDACVQVEQRPRAPPPAGGGSAAADDLPTSPGQVLARNSGTRSRRLSYVTNDVRRRGRG